MQIWNNLATFATALTSLGSNKAPVVIGYYPAWAIYQRAFDVAQIPVEKYTHIIYAFESVSIAADSSASVAHVDKWADVDKPFGGDVSGQQAYMGNFRQLNTVAKARNPKLKTLIGVGGWTLSDKFSDLAANEVSRQTFSESIKSWLDMYGFDGVDIDWEYPVKGGLETNKRRPEDAQNFLALLKQIRTTLGPSKLITIAASASTELLNLLDLKEISNTVDLINLMAYDYAGSWSAVTGHNANYIGATSLAISALLKQGVPSKKIVLGTPLYARAWSGVSAINNGLGQPFTGMAPGSYEAGVLDYKDVRKRLDEKTLTRYFDAATSSSYAYDAANKIFVSFDDVETVAAKVRQARKARLGGVMVWEVTGDYNNEILDTINRELYNK